MSREKFKELKMSREKFKELKISKEKFKEIYCQHTCEEASKILNMSVPTMFKYVKKIGGDLKGRRKKIIFTD